MAAARREVAEAAEVIQKPSNEKRVPLCVPGVFFGSRELSPSALRKEQPEVQAAEAAFRALEQQRQALLSHAVSRVLQRDMLAWVVGSLPRSLKAEFKQTNQTERLEPKLENSSPADSELSMCQVAAAEREQLLAKQGPPSPREIHLPNSKP